MDPSTLSFLIPKVPFLLKTALYHSLSLSSTASKWDLRTELTVKLIREYACSPQPSPVSKQQAMSLKDPGIKGKMWISKVTLPRPEEDDVRKAVVDAIEALKDGKETYTVPDIANVEAEWTGWRNGVGKDAPRPDLSEAEHYAHLMKEVSSDVTILYFHGGAYYLLDPSSHRPTTSLLAKLTHGRTLSVRYRLSPNTPSPPPCSTPSSPTSPSSPPPGSLHAPIPAHKIILAGDSAGGNLALSLLQLLLHLHRTHASTSSPPTVRFHGHDVPIPLPAGVAVNSAWMDLTGCMPSLATNAPYDYLPPPPSPSSSSTMYTIKYPPCPLWPTDPPRGALYCDASMLCHPLVSPLAARDWRGAPPVWMVYGEEMLVDEGRVVGRRAEAQGVKVEWVEFEAMPHCFAMVLDGGWHKGSRVCFEWWAGFCTRAVEARVQEARGVFVEARSLEERE
ncbi:MAG: hypothetical protein FRX48_08207 [Lasallia pustulata]|uniref:Alpha/beta hydrolase fold-3 domain-containing protein n=1 Tax=Lasallia pustulata TaxID=136370 RepID=A0A5M8PG09_9LECA|nr:MAG: hypothetical protein FRX48_08207 [Lasallia pustulata]